MNRFLTLTFVLILTATCAAEQPVPAPAGVASSDSLIKTPATRLRMAVVQMALRPTLAENRDRIVLGIQQAADRQARVAVFPERALTGSGSEQQALVDEAVEVIRDAAREQGVYVVSGAHTWLPSVRKNANWMFAIGPDGRELLRYEKLYDNHHARMPGVFHIDGVPCSAAICADRWLRGVVELPIQQGAQIFFELSNNYACEWVQPFEWYWNAPLARRNSVWSVLSNSGNRVSGVAAPPDHLKHGHSAVIAPDGVPLAVTSSDSEQLIVADIETSQATRAMARARAEHPALRLFWEAGLKIHQGQTIDPPSFKPLKSPIIEVTLAAAPVAGDLGRIEALISEARTRQADLVAFPAEAVSDDALDALRSAAREHQITVVVGVKHREPAGLRNSAFVIGPDGNVLTRYDQLSAVQPFQAGNDPRAMWFRVKGVPAVVTVGQDAQWTELAELAAVAGAQIHIHLDHEADHSAAARQRRLQTWVNCASFLTFTATVNSIDAMLWDDLRGRDETRAAVKGTPQPDSGVVEVYSPFSANLVARASAGELIVATRRVSALNPHHPNRTSNFNPQMKAWYELGAQLIGPAPVD